MSSSARVLVFGRSKVRIVGECNRTLVFSSLRGLMPQGWSNPFGDLKEVFSVLTTLLSSIKKINKRVILAFSKLVLEVVAFYNSPSISGAQIVNILVSLYLFREELQPQGLESFVLAGLSTLLPSKVFEIIRRAQVLTNAKICDDPSILFSILNALLSFVEDIVSYVPGASFIQSALIKVSGFFNFGKHHMLLRLAERYLVEAQNSKILLCQTFRDKCDKLNKDIESNYDILEWSRRSSSVQTILTKWRRLIKLVESYNNPYRQEPSCFVFEGPPGKMKSVILNNIVQALKEPCYSHIVKAVGNGKDFYDNYNNEPIFYMDDLGQEGVSQWRTLMNMVSAVKLPLDCAEASLKDTKFFNSDKIFITTNRFQNIVGLTKTDCIDDIKALHRRGYVFDFEHVQRDGDFIVGNVMFKYFMLSEGKFINDFPPEFKKISNIKPNFKIERGDSRSNLIAWFVAIIRVFEKVKKSHLVNNKLTDSEIDNIEQLVEDMVPQGLFSWVSSDDTEDITIESVSDNDDKDEDFENKLKTLKEHLSDYFFTEKEVEKEVKTLYRSEWWLELLCVSVKDYLKIMVNGIRKFVSNHPEATECVIRLCASALMGALIGVLARWLSGKIVAVEDLQSQSNFKYDIDAVHSSVPFIERNLHEVDMLCNNKVSQCVGLFSGHCMIVPAHLAASIEINVIVYANRTVNNRLVDGDKMTRVYFDNEEDVAIYRFASSFPSPFKKIYHLIKSVVVEKDLCSHLITVGGWHPVGKIQNNLKTRARQYKQIWPDGSVYIGKLRDGNFATYDVQRVGMCGSVLYNVENGIIGMHVAGDPHNDQGVAILWSRSLREKIIGVLSNVVGCELPFDVKEVKGEMKSVIKLDGDVFGNVPSMSNFGPSPLFGLYPVTRSPANLKYSGFHTVKDIAKKSFEPCSMVPQEEILFGQRVLRSMLSRFGDLSEVEIVKGTDWLAPLNNKSSNGYKCEKEKTFYINFEEGKFTDVFSHSLVQFERNLDSYVFDWQKLVWVETLKDEIRNDEKNGEPRSFRVGTIYNQVLTKKYFGRMVEHIIRNRSTNQVMIGCNPLVEWSHVYNKLLTGKVFAGDIKKWDGRMPSQVQRAVIETLLEFYDGEHKPAASILLESIVHSLLVVQDDLYLTTHSMSSGSFLTAIMNSLVNKFYTAMWYWRSLRSKQISPTVDGFWRHVDDFVYGDDKLNVVRLHDDVLNAISMRNFFLSLGMDFTDANKNSIQSGFQDISEVSFLKRSFVWHNVLQRIVCPLDLRTLHSGLSYVDFSKNVEDVMRDKLHAFQREIYLHPNREELLQDFVERLQRRNYKCDILSTEYLYNLYIDPNFVIPLSWGMEKYF